METDFLVFNNIFLFGIIVCIILWIAVIFQIPIISLIIPYFSKKAYWTIFIWRNLKNLVVCDGSSMGNHCFKVKNKDYIVVFLSNDHFTVYRGKTAYEIQRKHSIGGQCNKANYLTFWELWIGKKIEKWYDNYLVEREKKAERFRKAALETIIKCDCFQEK